MVTYSRREGLALAEYPLVLWRQAVEVLHLPSLSEEDCSGMLTAAPGRGTGGGSQAHGGEVAACRGFYPADLVFFARRRPGVLHDASAGRPRA